MDGFNGKDREMLFNVTLSVARLEQRVSDFIETTKQYIEERDLQCQKIENDLIELNKFKDKSSGWMGGAKYIISLAIIGFMAIVPNLVFYYKQFISHTHK